MNILLGYPNIESSQPTMSTPTTQAKTKQVEGLLRNDCNLFEMQMHPMMVPFLTPMKSNAKDLAAYIATVNHNRINMGLVTSIVSNMMIVTHKTTLRMYSNYKIWGQMQGMIVCYHEKHVRTCFSKIIMI